MSFSSPGFLFAFLPVFFLLYFAGPAATPGNWARNALLLAASLGFYSIDGGIITLVLVASVLVNHLLGRAILAAREAPARQRLLWFGIALNLAPLLYYKYWNFLLRAGSDTLTLFGAALGQPIALSAGDIVLPAGISFFTFQGISYLVDLARGDIAGARRLVDFGMYHTLFPQLIAGPIVRYKEVEDRVARRPLDPADIEAGALRFCTGLAKKIVIADAMGTIADALFALPAGQLDATAAWLATVAYTLQIYFDFSGYSDMAIGLGRMLGFRFPENFDLPYRSLSITEFWRRWHMTLSRWFRDYVYIPLGGNRAGPFRTHANLLAVFVLCGLWHGAAYSFLAWGLYHGALLVIERATGRGRAWLLPAALAWPLTLLLVMVGWVIFRAPTLEGAWLHLQAMAGLGTAMRPMSLGAILTPDKVTFLAIGSALALLPLRDWLHRPVLRPAHQVAALALFAYSALLIAANGFNPFIYFRF